MKRDHLSNLGIEERIILKLILDTGRQCGLDSSGAGYSSIAIPCEHINKHSIKGWKFFDDVTDNQLLSINRLGSVTDEGQ
jgi:hypothetical protein